MNEKTIRPIEFFQQLETLVTKEVWEKALDAQDKAEQDFYKRLNEKKSD